MKEPPTVPPSSYHKSRIGRGAVSTLLRGGQTLPFILTSQKDPSEPKFKKEKYIWIHSFFPRFCEKFCVAAGVKSWNPIILDFCATYLLSLRCVEKKVHIC